MAYIGRDTDKISNVEVLDNITFDGSSSYTLQKGGSNFTPSSANTLLLSIDGVVQAGNFTVSGSTIDFGTAVAGTSTCDFILHYGVGLITAPSDGTVTSAKIGANAVTNAKLNNDIISGATELATEPADTDEFLVSDAGTLKRIDYSLIKGGGITVADQFRLTSSLSFSSLTDVTANLERVDTAGQGGMTTNQMSESSGIFTFPLTGIYLVTFNMTANASIDARYVQAVISLTTDNSSYSTVATGTDSITQTGSTQCNVDTQTLVDVTDTSNVKVKFSGSASSTVSMSSSTTENRSSMTFIRLGDT